MAINRNIPALKVKQWLSDWNEVHWDSKQRRAEPQHWFYQFSIRASYLKALSGIYARTTNRQRGSDDLGIQRRHESDRSDEISRFVRYGYPWSAMNIAKRESGEFDDLRKPGWLPTAIIVNILAPKDKRRGKVISPDDLVVVNERSETPTIKLPASFAGNNWRHKSLAPIEIIDGQHRLWAFEKKELDGEFELPVVAFYGLDLSWQAYLFYTINIKPKKINPSLAFDLYPLLRTEDWLTKFEGPAIYRESRAQELVDLLWSQDQSPWYHRINMLGESGFKGVMLTQASWIRSLLATYIKSWEGGRTKIGGLFGAPMGKDDTVLPWSRTEQAAFLIVVGQQVARAVKNSKDKWTKDLRQNSAERANCSDPAFDGSHSLLNQDQGLRVLLNTTNDLLYVKSDELELAEWGDESSSNQSDSVDVATAIKSLQQQKQIMAFVKEMAQCLSTYDWRASSASGLTESERLKRAAFRGSGGYKELRRDLLRHLIKAPRTSVSKSAKEVLNALGY